MARFDWTEERLADLRRLFHRGLGATEIAVEIGAPTRNVVAGKLHHLGLRRRDFPALDERPSQKRRRAPRAAKAAKNSRIPSGGDITAARVDRAAGAGPEKGRSACGTSGRGGREPSAMGCPQDRQVGTTGAAAPAAVPAKEQKQRLHPGNIARKAEAKRIEHVNPEARRGREALALMEAEAIAPGGVSLVDLRGNHCRWLCAPSPGGMPTYCGCQTKFGSSYCPEHHARVWMAPPQRDKK
ncbi:GcrA family cell cycle regulator [Chelatococcus sp. XZ-Ab1]|uniref:GcrA family cell cycle regulator n=1 Tax=Chelatococcus sp. XZ-Ab1 TaxID=3034027 RepID=UPI0023E3EAFE|nr:GcrA family cell cycle regulator [Chelatococcus sp. XZ-Ab1]